MLLCAACPGKFRMDAWIASLAVRSRTRSIHHNVYICIYTSTIRIVYNTKILHIYIYIYIHMYTYHCTHIRTNLHMYVDTRHLKDLKGSPDSATLVTTLAAPEAFNAAIAKAILDLYKAGS